MGIEVGVTAGARQEHKSLEGDSEFVSAELVLLADDTQMTLARRTGFILNPAAVARARSNGIDGTDARLCPELSASLHAPSLISVMCLVVSWFRSH